MSSNKTQAFAAAVLVAALLGVGCSESETCKEDFDKFSRAAPAESETLFDRAVLHRVDLVVASSDLDSLRGRDGRDVSTRVPVDVTYDGVAVTHAGVRLKGASTFVGIDDRASFSIKFNEFVKGQRLGGMKKLVLNSMLHDPTLVRTPASFSLAAAAGLPAPRVAYALVTFNGEPFGLYNVIEPINKQFLASSYAQTDAWGNLYEATGDFDLISRPRVEGSIELNKFDLKDADEGRCLDDVKELQRSLMEATDAEFASELRRRVEVPQLLRLLALEAVLVDPDGYAQARNNFYLYHRPSTDLFEMLPWGMDSVLLTALGDPLSLSTSDNSDIASVLIPRLVANPSLLEEYRAAVVDVAGKFDAQSILSELDMVETWLGELTDTGMRVEADIALFAESQAALRTVVLEREAVLSAALPRRGL